MQDPIATCLEVISWPYPSRGTTGTERGGRGATPAPCGKAAPRCNRSPCQAYRPTTRVGMVEGTSLAQVGGALISPRTAAWAASSIAETVQPTREIGALQPNWGAPPRPVCPAGPCSGSRWLRALSRWDKCLGRCNGSGCGGPWLRRSQALRIRHVHGVWRVRRFRSIRRVGDLRGVRLDHPAGVSVHGGRRLGGEGGLRPGVAVGKAI